MIILVSGANFHLVPSHTDPGQWGDTASTSLRPLLSLISFGEKHAEDDKPLLAWFPCHGRSDGDQLLLGSQR